MFKRCNEMLDTVKLQLEPGSFVITDYRKFGATKAETERIYSVFKKWYNNPTAADKKAGLYLPRLTLGKRGARLFLKVEFSAPKLLFNNNLDELGQDDFSDVIEALGAKLRAMGVNVWTHELVNAPVMSFQPSKNILLDRGYTAGLAIRELEKIDISRRYDIDKKEFRNGGEVLQIYTNAIAIALYDKMQDMGKPAKRAFDKDRTAQQLDLFRTLQEREKKLEIIRIEVRPNRAKLRQMLAEHGFTSSPVFQDIFKQELCQKIIYSYWQSLFMKDLFLFNAVSDPQEILQLALRQYPQAKLMQVIKIIGLYMLCRDEAGMRGFRRVIEAYRTDTSWTAVKRELQVFEDKIFRDSVRGFVKKMDKDLRNFYPLKMDLLCKEK